MPTRTNFATPPPPSGSPRPGPGDGLWRKQAGHANPVPIDHGNRWQTQGNTYICNEQANDKQDCRYHEWDSDGGGVDGVVDEGEPNANKHPNRKHKRPSCRICLMWPARTLGKRR